MAWGPFVACGGVIAMIVRAALPHRGLRAGSTGCGHGCGVLALYVALPIFTWIRTRSLAWTVLAIAGAIAVAGVLVNFMIDRGFDITRGHLQWILLIAFVVVAVIAWVRPWRGSQASMSRQSLAVLVPSGVLLAAFAIVTVRLTEGFAFLRPVGFFIGQVTAEDNAKWLDFTAQWAAGGGIEQAVPLGGPLQLYLTFVGTLMAVISQVVLGGFNEVAVAANSVVYGEFILAILMPFAFAPMAEAKFRGSAGRGKRGFVPLPGLWLGMLVLVTVTVVVVQYGHLTLQYTFLVAGLWAATFLSGSKVPRARLVSSLAFAAAAAVWSPLSVPALIVVGVWLVSYAVRLVRSVPEPWTGGAWPCCWWWASGCSNPRGRASRTYCSPPMGQRCRAGGGGLVATSAGRRCAVAAGIDPVRIHRGHRCRRTAVDRRRADLSARGVGSGHRQPVRTARRLSRFAPLGLLTFFALSIYSLDAWRPAPRRITPRRSSPSWWCRGVGRDIAGGGAGAGSGGGFRDDGFAVDRGGRRGAAAGGRFAAATGDRAGAPGDVVPTHSVQQHLRLVLVPGGGERSGRTADRRQSDRMRVSSRRVPGSHGDRAVRAVRSAAGVCVHEAIDRLGRCGHTRAAAGGLAATRMADQHPGLEQCV